MSLNKNFVNLFLLQTVFDLYIKNGFTLFFVAIVFPCKTFQTVLAAKLLNASFVLFNQLA